MRRGTDGGMLSYRDPGTVMGQMSIRKLDDAAVAALRARARANNRSAGAGARTILSEALTRPAPRLLLLADFIGAAPTGRTQAEIDHDINALRDEWESR